MKKIINLTPHAIVLNDGTIFESQGVARVSATFSEFSEGVCSQEFGEITGLPPQGNIEACEASPCKGWCEVYNNGKYANCTKARAVTYIVSGMVLAAAKAAGRTDCVAPATGHPDTIRNEKGQIISVPGFVN